MAFRQEWADAVRRAVGDRSRRALAPQVGVTASYIGDWLLGQVPAKQKVLDLAAATGADASDLLRAAGYAPEFSPDERLGEIIREVRAEFGFVPPFSLQDWPARSATEEEVERLGEEIRRMAREWADQHGKGGAAGPAVGRKGKERGPLRRSDGPARAVRILCPA